jgi:hypothetical protein
LQAKGVFGFIGAGVGCAEIITAKANTGLRSCRHIGISARFFSLSADMHCTFVAETPAFMITINAD